LLKVFEIADDELEFRSHYIFASDSLLDVLALHLDIDEVGVEGIPS
jgi:hypothetical protein